MTAISRFAKKLSDLIPAFRDQGIEWGVASGGGAHTGIQSTTFTVGSGSGGLVVTFADQGLSDMKDGSYQVFVHNHTDAADEATVAIVARNAQGFTLVGPDQNDVLDILVVGKLAGQL